MKYEEGEGGVVLCKDPFATTNSAVDELIEMMRRPV